MTIRSFVVHVAGRIRGRFPTATRFAASDDAQDVIEYALLAAFIGVAGYLALNAITTAVAATYASWLDPAVGVPSAWDPPEPPAGGGS